MLASDILLAYSVTANRFDRFLRSLEMQNFVYPELKNYSFLVTNANDDTFPDLIKEYFEDRIVFIDAFVTDEHNHRAISISKLRNACIDAARRRNVAWVLLADADTVIHRLNIPDRAAKCALPNVYWQKSSNETIEQSLFAIADGGQSAFSAGNSWFILSKEVFENFDFNENFVGYGFEDLEFSVRLQLSGYSFEKCSTEIVHVFHSEDARDVRWWQFKRNEAIFEASRIALSSEIRTDWRMIEVRDTINPSWSGHICFDHQTNTVIDPSRKIIGKFISDGDQVDITWPGQKVETYYKTGIFLKYKEES